MDIETFFISSSPASSTRPFIDFATVSSVAFEELRRIGGLSTAETTVFNIFINIIEFMLNQFLSSDGTSYSVLVLLGILLFVSPILIFIITIQYISLRKKKKEITRISNLSYSKDLEIYQESSKNFDSMVNKILDSAPPTPNTGFV